VQEHGREWNAASRRLRRSKRNCSLAIPMWQGCYSALRTGMWSLAFSTRNNNGSLVPIGREMLRVQRRVENLEWLLRVKTKPAHVIRINSIDMDGQVVGTMVSSSDPALCVPYRKIEDAERNQSED
jgi:hypothetical protein